VNKIKTCNFFAVVAHASLPWSLTVWTQAHPAVLTERLFCR